MRDATLQPARGNQPSGSDKSINAYPAPSDDVLDGLSPKYFSYKMKTQITAATRVGKCEFGYGLFATRKLKRGAVVGYYSGPVLTWNNWDKYQSEDDYVAGGEFVYPDSGKKMTYHIMVVGPTRYMNHGHNPDYFRRKVPAHGMIANVQMQQECMVEIGNQFRPVFAFKTICGVEKDAELLYDYGVHDDEIYYEYLRRRNVPDSARERRSFRKLLGAIEKNRYAEWLAGNSGHPANDWDARNEFYLALLKQYLDAPDSIINPTNVIV